MYRILSLVISLIFLTTASFAQTSISTARSQPFGSTVTVSGIVTVANELLGPSYLQDETGGIAVFENPFHTAVSIGDSVVVTGPMTDYGNNGTDGSGLTEITGSGITFQVFKNANRLVSPKIISITDINENLEGQLIQIKDAYILADGTFKGNTNYNISDSTGYLAAGLRIDKDVASLVGEPIPNKTDITGVLSQYLGSYQILPRFSADLNLTPIVTPPTPTLPSDSTFDVVTWNTEWLGYGGATYGPADDNLQVQNAIKIFRTIGADLFAIQEMSNTDAFQTILDSLPQYGGYYAPFSQTQKTAFLYLKSTITPISHDYLFTAGDWASGRYPFQFVFDYKSNNTNYRIHAVNIHAKATGSSTKQNDYTRRVTDSNQIKTYFDTFMSNDRIILLGDFNDDVDVSVVSSQTSPYANFVNDATNYRAISKYLSDNNIKTHQGGSTLDHIVISNELFSEYIENSIHTEKNTFIPNYNSTSSDHYPVMASFKFSPVVTSVSLPNEPSDFTLLGNYPNPFNPSTTLQFTTPHSSQVTVEVVNVLGQQIAILVNGQLDKGYHNVPFNAASLSSGVYFYTVKFNQMIKTGKLILTK